MSEAVRGLRATMKILDESSGLNTEKKIYFCDDGGHCFICTGRDSCNNFRYGIALGSEDKGYFEEIPITAPKGMKL